MRILPVPPSFRLNSSFYLILYDPKLLFLHIAQALPCSEIPEDGSYYTHVIAEEAEASRGGSELPKITQ